MSVTCQRIGNLGMVTIDNPPVNVIGQVQRQGLLEAAKWAELENLDRVILAGAGTTFAAGADADEFDGPALEPHLPAVLDTIERSFVPWIAAINGVAFGSGAEIAMACRMRITSPTAQLGLPEVTLGVIPGAGGTQRLPRLVGLERALEMVTTGIPIRAQTALAIKLVEDVDDDPINAAYMVVTEELKCRVPVWELPPPAHDAEVLANARLTIAKHLPNQIAPQRAIDAIEAGLTMPFRAAMQAEREIFLALRTSNQAKALRHIFVAQPAAKPPPWLTAQTASLNIVAVVGSGSTGASITYSLLQAGLDVVLLDADSDALSRAQYNIEQIISAALDSGLIDAPRAEDIRARLKCSSDYTEAAGAMLAIEVASGGGGATQDIIGRLQATVPRDAILATNSPDFDQIARTLDDPSRVIGLSFSEPAYNLQLLEIIKGDATSDTALATGFALAKLLRATPVLTRGSITERIQARNMEAADTVFMDASTPWEVDEAMVAFGYAMGPYEAQDLTGLDVAYFKRRRQDATRDPNRRYIPIADRMIELGKLGKHTSAGWYRYPGGNGKVEDPIVADLALEEAHFAKVTRYELTEQQISDRLVLAMINEAADLLYEGIAARARDIDLVTVLGQGFPQWRGGLMHYADTLGISNIVDALTELGREDPLVWAISPALLHCRQHGITLAQYNPDTG